MIDHQGNSAPWSRQSLVLLVWSHHTILPRILLYTLLPRQSESPAYALHACHPATIHTRQKEKS